MGGGIEVEGLPGSELSAYYASDIRSALASFGFSLTTESSILD